MKLLIYGNGAMARILYSYARHTMDVCGFTVDDVCIAENSATFCNLPLVPFSTVEETFDPKSCKMIVAIGFIDMNDLRRKKSMEAEQKGYSFTKFVHESLLIHDEVSISENCIILEHASIQTGCTIETGTFIANNVSVGHDGTIGAFSWINSGVTFAGGSNIGSECFFGVNSSVSHGIKIGARNLVGANTFVNKNTKDDEVYLSEPGTLCRIDSKTFFRFSQILD